MKTLRLLSMLLASLAISTAAFAADAATTFSLKGQARVKKGENYTRLAVGTGIEDGSFVQVGAKSTLGLKTADGSTVYFRSNSSFRLRYIPDSGPGHMEITLLGGTVSGNFSSGANGSTVVRTSAGVVDTNGASAAVTFTPNATGGGSLNIVATTGSVTITPPGSTTPVTIPAGSAYSTGAGVRVATPGELAIATGLVNSGIANGGLVASPGSSGSVQTNVPDLSVTTPMSPNGEGQLP